ncbi:hypothetical protein [Schlesneria sp. DSM 10557]|uniref:hypothetical protein n=1 Tax=Schlesneria sp. DSM 10557 TaxID=3044399 RepID=UPI0035A040DD
MIEVLSCGHLAFPEEIDFTPWSAEELHDLNVLAKATAAEVEPKLGQWIVNATDGEMTLRAQMAVAGITDYPPKLVPFNVDDWDDAELSIALGLVYGWAAMFQPEYPAVSASFRVMCDAFVVSAAQRLHKHGRADSRVTAVEPSLN